MMTALVLFLGGVVCGITATIGLCAYWLIQSKRNWVLVFSYLLRGLAQSSGSGVIWLRSESSWNGVSPDDLIDGMARYVESAVPGPVSFDD